MSPLVTLPGWALGGARGNEGLGRNGLSWELKRKSGFSSIFSIILASGGSARLWQRGRAETLTWMPEKKAKGNKPSPKHAPGLSSTQPFSRRGQNVLNLIFQDTVAKNLVTLIPIHPYPAKKPQFTLKSMTAAPSHEQHRENQTGIQRELQRCAENRNLLA